MIIFVCGVDLRSSLKPSSGGRRPGPLTLSRAARSRWTAARPRGGGGVGGSGKGVRGGFARPARPGALPRPPLRQNCLSAGGGRFFTPARPPRPPAPGARGDPPPGARLARRRRARSGPAPPPRAGPRRGAGAPGRGRWSRRGAGGGDVRLNLTAPRWHTFPRASKGCAARAANLSTPPPSWGASGRWRSAWAPPRRSRSSTTTAPAVAASGGRGGPRSRRIGRWRIRPPCRAGPRRWGASSCSAGPGAPWWAAPGLLQAGC